MKTIAIIIIALSSLTLKAAAVSVSPEHSAQRVSISTPAAVLKIAANELSKTKSSAAGECSVICALPSASDGQ
ncbi:MAG: hypothetical protein WA970_22270 [Gammaproteobacteria bacterium]